MLLVKYSLSDQIVQSLANRYSSSEKWKILTYRILSYYTLKVAIKARYSDDK